MEYLTLVSPFPHIIDESKIVFYGIDYDTFTKPYIKYSFDIFDDLTFKLWHEDVTLDARNYLHIVETNKLSYFSQIERFLELLPNLNCPAISINEEINNCVQKLDNLAKNVDESIHPKLQFIIEQLKLAFMHIKHHRYSVDLLSMCVLWENTSSNLYKQIRNEGMLTIPSFRYIKKLISAITVETGLTDQSIKYLEARIAKLNDREKIGSLIFDEIYVAKRCEFSRSTGQIFRMENNQPTKTLLTIMFKSVAAEYEDVIGMVPLTIISSSILHELFTKVLESITAIGYEVVVNLVDGHSSNVKFYKKELIGDKPALFIVHPFNPEKMLFLLFDGVFKCICNNFQMRIVFECPNFGDMPVSPNFNYIVELYNIELSKPIKMAYQLNDECLNPQPIEKTRED